jgi:iron(III) transport system permease protein
VVIGVGILSTSAWLGSWLPLLNEWLGHGLLLGLLLLIYAYGVRFFSVGFQGIEAALKRISPSMDQSAQSLGHSAWQILRRVHWPLLKPTVTACALLVFVDALKELPATLVLRPFNFDTLAVVAYQFASDERLGEAAWPCLLMVTIGLVPIWWLASVQRKTAML